MDATTGLERSVRARAAAAAGADQRAAEPWTPVVGQVIAGKVISFTRRVGHLTGPDPDFIADRWSPGAASVTVANEADGVPYIVALEQGGHLELLCGSAAPAIVTGERVVIGAVGAAPIARSGAPGVVRFALALSDRGEAGQVTDTAPPTGPLPAPPWKSYLDAARLHRDLVVSTRNLGAQYGEKIAQLMDQVEKFKALQAGLPGELAASAAKVEASAAELRAAGLGHIVDGPGVPQAAAPTGTGTKGKADKLKPPAALVALLVAVTPLLASCLP